MAAAWPAAARTKCSSSGGSSMYLMSITVAIHLVQVAEPNRLAQRGTCCQKRAMVHGHGRQQQPEGAGAHDW